MVRLYIGIVIMTLFLSGCGVSEQNHLSTEQQAMYDKIDEAVSKYPTWEELGTWVEENDIEWGLRDENGNRPTEEMFDAMDKYGMVGSFLSGEPSVNPDNGVVFLLTRWENLGHNTVIEEIESLNHLTFEDFESWLTNEGMELIDQYYTSRDIIAMDQEGNVLIDPYEDDYIGWYYEIEDDSYFDIIVMFSPQIKYMTYESIFEFDNFKIEIGSRDDTIWRQVDNRFADKNGADVFGIPVTFTNLGDNTGTLSSSRYKFFGPDGREIRSISSYFREDDIWSQGDMRPEASQQGYLMIEYVGDGDYIIEFSFWSESSIDVILTVTK